MLLSIIAVLVVLSPIVIIHEFGHFIACRLTGIGVKELLRNFFSDVPMSQSTFIKIIVDNLFL